MASSSLPILDGPRPGWLRAPAPSTERTDGVRQQLRRLPTVCEEARCPNQGERWADGTATFLLMGDVCTRACRFCAVTSGRPAPLDDDEPARLRDAVLALGLTDVVLTSVDRDDLDDGGAWHLARCVTTLKDAGLQVELLAPDFGGDADRVAVVVDSGLDVFAHNVETVPRLSRQVRDRRASFSQSLAVLAAARRRRADVLTKSGLMLGLGEDDDEVVDAMVALRDVDVDILTLGQYLRRCAVTCRCSVTSSRRCLRPLATTPAPSASRWRRDHWCARRTRRRPWPARPVDARCHREDRQSGTFSGWSERVGDPP